MDSLALNLHVLCEKPMCCTIARAKKVVEAARKSILSGGREVDIVHGPEPTVRFKDYK